MATNRTSAADFIPPRPTLAKLREAAAHCRGCHLWKDATQTVFGEGPGSARLMLVGEQPGDQEDRAGRPFVGPAGRLLDDGLAAAGLDRREVYVTNAVKHFKFVRQELTRRRLHKKPTAAEVRACRPWLEWEIRLVKPRVIVALGATAAQALLGSGFKVTEQRGKAIQSEWAEAVIATVHPSSVLRAPSEVRDRAKREFFEDLKRAAEYLASLDEPGQRVVGRGPRLRRGQALPPVAAGRRGGSVVGSDRSA
jgi:uracil-DNA glycosylase family protein